MKNSKNKIIAALACGVIVGSIGTSFIGKYQAEEKEIANNSTSNNGNNSTNSDSTSNSINKNSTDIYNNYTYAEEGNGSYNIEQGASKDNEMIDLESVNYKDGTYTGIASGYSSGLKVQIVISSGKIKDVDVVSHNETPGFCEIAIEKVPYEIIANQSTNVDTVSGATYTSMGIITAVNDALSNVESN